jgi:protein-tyrosine phosphatase
MSLILEKNTSPFLYLGGKSSASNDHFLIDSKITHILNVAEESENYFPEKFKYLKFDLEDTDECQISEVFEESNKFLDNIYNSNGTVLVHCVGLKKNSF